MMRFDVTLDVSKMTACEARMRPAELVYAHGFADWTRTIMARMGQCITLVACTRSMDTPLPRCFEVRPHVAPEEGANE